MEYKLADRMSYLKASEIREILKVTERPEVISFAGGLPAPELFPIEAIQEASNRVFEEEGYKALQYTTTEGYRPLREWISNRMNKRWQTAFEPDNIVLTHGSQQALDLSGKVFLDQGDIVLCESPTYLAAISAFKAYGCEFIEVPTDNEGMITSQVESILETQGNRVKLIYVIPDFQNPTGRTWSLRRREQLVKLATKYEIVIIEDNPYGELRFEGEMLPSLQSFDDVGCVVSLGSFSKVFCPGYRIGWVMAHEKLIEKYVLVKQGADLQCNTMAQMVISKYLELYNIDEHIDKIRDVYRQRRDAAIEVMEKEFPKEVKFTRPEGGLFAWVELPTHINARVVLEKCLEKNVAFVPGGSFFPNGGNENTLRLNFSNMPVDRIKEGLKCLARVLNQLNIT
ncbi:2-aminoadipate transaminase [Natranaerovirga pectinivora]|uniref:2-aminoadipate transaminase n=1 Tax=Natranaerovirga pectinivora TaxID=682400 RepID=A0A4V2V0P4_9FIRM|nr:PLP-dependent aminotransferase family protein [Natranaerovirga pectinivora]TCT17139.1 2-aminoadipate transaminase [Natranaerovirga pectinivora]